LKPLERQCSKTSKDLLKSLLETKTTELILLQLDTGQVNQEMVTFTQFNTKFKTEKQFKLQFIFHQAMQLQALKELQKLLNSLVKTAEHLEHLCSNKASLS
jgi:hypothetical protein